MIIDTSKPLTQDEADHRHMLDHAFKKTPLDPEVAKRVHERAAKVRKEKVRNEMDASGVTIDAVEFLRECHDER